MRHLRLLALLVPALLLPVGCEDSDSAPAAAMPFEAGPGFEGGPGATDASVAPTDAAQPDSAPTPGTGVTVTVHVGVALKAGIRVIAQDAAGAVIDDLTTGASGKVAFKKATPSMVTVLSKTDTGEGDDDDALTVLGIVDGDNLDVALSTAFAIEPVVVGTYAVALKPPYLTTDAIYSVSLGGACANSTTNPALGVTVPAYDYCVNTSNALLASVLGPSNTFGFGFAKNVARPMLNGTVAIDIGSFLAKGATKLVATNLPTGSRSTDLRSVANGATFGAGEGTGDFSEGGITFDTATGFAEAYQSRTVVATNEEDGSTRIRTLIRREVTTAPAAVTLPNIDLGTLLPTVSASIVSTALRPDVTLASAPTIATTDGGAVTLSWFSAVNVRSSWTFIVPPSTKTFKVPALPADAAAFAPNEEVGVKSVIIAESSLLPGFAQLKALPLTPGHFFSLIDEERALPADGTVRITEWRPTPD